MQGYSIIAQTFKAYREEEGDKPKELSSVVNKAFAPKKVSTG